MNNGIPSSAFATMSFAAPAGTNTFSFTIGPEGQENGPDLLVGKTPYRQIAYIGATYEEVIGSMLHSMARLARDGSLNPARPDEPGVPPVQHALSVLSERLQWHLGERNRHLHQAHENLRMNGQPLPDVPRGGIFHEQCLVGTVRCNEVIAALGTAIAALARVRDL